MTTAKGSKNAKRTNSDSGKRQPTRLGNFIRTKRQSNAASTSESTDNTIDADIQRINTIIANDTFDAHNGIITESSESRSGSGRSNGRDGRRTDGGIGEREPGSGRDTDSDSASDKPKRRGRRSAEDRARELAEQDSISLEEARKIIETQKKPRKIKSFSDDISDGVAGSAILLGGIFEGGSSLLAMALSNKQFDRSYIKLEKEESQSLGDAVLKVIEAQSKYNRKRFDALMAKVYPYWNLAKVLTEITYPRYNIYKMELELKIELAKQATAEANTRKHNQDQTGQVDNDFQASSPGFSSVNGVAAWPE